jgi:xylulokinase
VMEGVCFALRDSLELMRPFVDAVPEIRAIGGGARSELWRQMQADVFDAPVATLGDGGGPAYGAAVMAAVGADMFGSIADAAGAWVSVEARTGPDSARVRVYDELYEAYRQFYPNLKERFAVAAELSEKLGRGELCRPRGRADLA